MFIQCCKVWGVQCACLEVPVPWMVYLSKLLPPPETSLLPELVSPLTMLGVSFAMAILNRFWVKCWVCYEARVQIHSCTKIPSCPSPICWKIIPLSSNGLGVWSNIDLGRRFVWDSQQSVCPSFTEQAIFPTTIPPYHSQNSHLWLKLLLDFPFYLFDLSVWSGACLNPKRILSREFLWLIPLPSYQVRQAIGGRAAEPGCRKEAEPGGRASVYRADQRGADVALLGWWWRHWW